MIEVKGTKGDFIKLADGEIANYNKKGECLYNLSFASSTC
jgi:hypothetical protein